LRVTARCGSCRLPLQRLAVDPRRASTVARARPGSRGVDFPFRVSWCRPSSAFLAPSAPASLVRPSLAVFPVRPDPGPKPGAPLLRFVSPAEPDRGPTARAPVHVTTVRVSERPPPCQARDSPLVGSCSLERYYAGCPLSPHHDLSTAAGWVEVARPPPVPSSGFLPLSTVLATHAVLHGPLRIRRHRGAPTLRGLVSCRSRPWSRPSELSLLEEPYPLSRASCFLAGSRSTNPTARHEPRDSRLLSPLRRPLAAAGPKARRTGRPGRRFPGVARTLRVTRCRARLQRPRLESAGLTGYGGRHARFEALLPSRVRSLQRSPPWPGDDRPVGALLGFCRVNVPTGYPAGPTDRSADGTLRVSSQGEPSGCARGLSFTLHPLEFTPAIP